MEQRANVFQDEDAYVSPFLTCENCNGISFVDVESLREKRGETVTPCPKCGKTTRFVVGAKDLSEMVIQRLIRTAAFNKRFVAAVYTAQRIARGFIARKRYQRLRNAYLSNLKDMTTATLMLQRAYKNYRRRRDAAVQRALWYIKHAPRKVRFAAVSWNPPAYMIEFLRLRKTRPAFRVWWYDDAEEEETILVNHKVFVERCGNVPSLRSVESNIIEIAERIKEIEDINAAIIQRVYRGMLARRFFIALLRQRAETMQRQLRAIIRIQRFFRHHFYTRQLSEAYRQRAIRKHMQAYQAWAAKRMDVEMETNMRQRALAYYRYEARTTRMAVAVAREAYKGPLMRSLDKAIPYKLPETTIYALTRGLWRLRSPAFTPQESASEEADDSAEAPAQAPIQSLRTNSLKGMKEGSPGLRSVPFVSSNSFSQPILDIFTRYRVLAQRVKQKHVQQELQNRHNDQRIIQKPGLAAYYYKRHPAKLRQLQPLIEKEQKLNPLAATRTSAVFMRKAQAISAHEPVKEPAALSHPIRQAQPIAAVPTRQIAPHNSHVAKQRLAKRWGKGMLPGTLSGRAQRLFNLNPDEAVE